MKTREQALEFRANIIRKLATNRPELQDKSGIGFWPVPIMIPVVLAKCIYGIHKEWLQQITLGNDDSAAMLSQVRIKLTHLVAEGDLGEDHAGLYIKEHPEVKKVNIKTSPFFIAYQTILDEEDPFKLLGFIYSVEVGSLAAVTALTELEFIQNKNFAALHMHEEVEHDKLAEEIKALIANSAYQARFAQGCEMHDSLYEAIA